MIAPPVTESPTVFHSNTHRPTLPGLFITLEGGEGVGKTTIVPQLAAALQRIGDEVVTTREPGHGAIGQAIREILLLSANTNLDPRTEALLFAADRAQHVSELIRPALQRGATVLCDRYIDSSVAYQGHARGLGTDQIAYLSDWGTDGLTPDLTILIDLDPAVGLSRKSRQNQTNRMEDEKLSFHTAVRAGFLALAKTQPSRFSIINGDQSIETIQEAILQVVLLKLWSRRNLN